METGSSVRNLNKEKVQKVVISKPPLPEQTAIAEILSDMDAEIDALMAKLNKLRNIKRIYSEPWFFRAEGAEKPKKVE